MRAGSVAATELVEAFLRHFANLRIEAVSFEVAREAPTPSFASRFARPS